MGGGENIKKIAIAALLILSIGVLIGGYSFILNDGGSDLTDNSIPNQLNDSSKDNVSLDNNMEISNENSNIKVIKDVLGNDLEEKASLVNSIQLNVLEDSDVPAQIFVFSGNVAYLAFPGNLSLNSNQDYQLNDVNKSEYVLSPNYDKNIFIKIGQNFTDLFVQCVDGDFMPLGDITRPLPQKGICDLSCGPVEAYFDLNSPYVDYRNYDDVVYYIEHGKYPSDNQQIEDNYVNKSEYVLSPNYDKNIFIKIGQNFTDLFVQCVDGDFMPLGDITRPLPQKGICDLSCGAGEAYFDLNSPADYRNYDDVVYYIEHGEYPTNDLIDDPVTTYSGEPVYGGDYADESNDVNSINEELPQENAAAENPQIEICPINVG